ncbi:hypothetical protein TREPR_2076 [Treponema primitia ZAS-2]|uniref:Uncharacterized protein n=1 Tax=Treponema primitia (strain ATCC BAA-887 / DSM 12427 / ZAS-2) TaxID=545694 RepID=F5YJR2_TREPZ|nr:hypothetical protein TREPR_2076 [Treponema primitia ZAS-2]
MKVFYTYKYLFYAVIIEKYPTILKNTLFYYSIKQNKNHYYTNFRSILLKNLDYCKLFGNFGKIIRG